MTATYFSSSYRAEHYWQKKSWKTHGE